MIDFKQLTRDLLQIAEAAAPLVGLAEEVQAGRDLIAAIDATITTARDAIDSEDHSALSDTLDALSAKVNAHADAVQERLRG